MERWVLSNVTPIGKLGVINFILKIRRYRPFHILKSNFINYIQMKIPDTLGMSALG
jgi:hypothetical protein